MKQNNIHPAIKTAKDRMFKRYIIACVSLVLCAILVAIGFVFKPEQKEKKPEIFTKKTAVDTYVKSDINYILPAFSQDELDENGKKIGETYHLLASDTDGNRFVLSVPKEYYENTLKPLENNSVQELGSGQLEILDENLKVEVFGYAREMSNNLKAQMDNYLSGYESTFLPFSLEAVEEPQAITPINYFFIAAGFLGIITLCIFISALSLTSNYKRVKKKYAKKNENK